ncbi:MAG TPA: hypothetical protein VIR30_17020 [Nocardioides sp.]
MSSAYAVATAFTFVWLGMVLAISFIEAPLKFRAPGVTIPLGLGIGRLVFRALNSVELLLAAGIVVCLVVAEARTSVWIAAAVGIVVLLAQVGLVRPSLTRRSNAVLAGEDAPRSNAHLVYVALELAKVIALVVTGVLLLS